MKLKKYWILFIESPEWDGLPNADNEDRFGFVEGFDNVMDAVLKEDYDTFNILSATEITKDDYLKTL